MKISNAVVTIPRATVARPTPVEEEQQLRVASERKENKQLPQTLSEPQFPETTPEQVEAVLLQARQSGESGSRSAPAQQDLPAFSRNAISAYQTQTQQEQREFVRSVVAGIDIFV